MNSRIVVALALAGCGQEGSVYVFHGPLASSSVPARIDPGGYTLAVVAAGDIDGDGRPDFIVSSDETTGLYFGVHDHADASTNEHDSVVPLGDIDADGRADLLVGSLDADESLAERFYPGSAHPFDSAGTPISGYPIAATAADVDGDGIADLVVASAVYDQQAIGQCDVSAYHGGSTFDLTAPQTVVQLPGSPELALQSAGDIDGDGRDDLVLAGQCLGSDSLAVYFGGVPLTSPPSRVIAAVAFPVVAKDFDGDGFGDLAVSVFGDVLVYFGPALDTPRLQIPGTLADAGDVDGDGYPDLIVIGPTGDVDVVLGGPGMDETPAIELAPPNGVTFSSAAYVGEVDGTVELVAAYAGWRAE